MPKELPKGVSVDRDRHGNARLYFRAGSKAKVRLRETPSSPEFDREVACARLGIPYLKPEGKAPVAVRKAAPDSFQWLVGQYKARAKNKLAEDQLARRVRLLEEICDSKTEGGKRRGDLPFALMERKHVIEIRDQLRDTAGAQNNLVKTISAMFGWAVEAAVASANPALAIKDLYAGDGFHTWTVEEVERFDARHPVGTTARLAKDIAAFTGLRRKQVAILGRQHNTQVFNEETAAWETWIKITPGKTIKTSGVVVEVPLLPILAETIAASDTGDLTYLKNELGRAFTSNGLGNKFRQWCDEAELFGCSMHGLRKAGATIAANNGATDDQLMAIFGWTTKKQSGHYTKNADRKRLAGKAMHKLVPERKVDKTVPPPQPVEKSGAKIAK